MKYAVISVSKEGARLGQRVRSLLPGGVSYERRGSESGDAADYFTRTLALTSEIFSKYDGLLYIMASGIVVRAVAPHVVSKTSDPAVLVMDECGRHCISLLSGHLGGANAWAREVAAAVGAEPVITTATDVHGRLAPDDAARMLHMRVEPVGALKPVNSAIAEGKSCRWYVDSALSDAAYFKEKLEAFGAKVSDDLENIKNDSAAVIVTERSISCPVPHVYLRPRNLFVGMGCKRGTPEALIREAFEGALAKAGVRASQVASLASVDLKADEKGLLDFAEHMGLPIHFYPAEELRKCGEEHHVEISEFVEKTIGVGNVCETAALAEASMGKTLLAKTKFTKATAAIAVGSSV